MSYTKMFYNFKSQVADGVFRWEDARDLTSQDVSMVSGPQSIGTIADLGEIVLLRDIVDAYDGAAKTEDAKKNRIASVTLIEPGGHDIFWAKDIVITKAARDAAEKFVKEHPSPPIAEESWQCKLTQAGTGAVGAVLGFAGGAAGGGVVGSVAGPAGTSTGVLTGGVLGAPAGFTLGLNFGEWLCAGD